jgi:isopentenyl-diphosphate delta-isomerase
MEKKYPTLSIQPSTIFLKNAQSIATQSLDSIETCLNLGILPILYGDIIFDINGSFSIISGDDIILELCKHIKNYQVSKVIFSMESDGLYIQERDDDKKFLSEIDIDELDDLKLADLGQKIDVTGGIRGKINKIKEICKLRIPVQLINGLNQDTILKALKNQEVISTSISCKSINSKTIIDRKIEHMKIPLKQNVQHSENYFKYIKLIHHPLPEFELTDIDLSVNFFGKKISAPICIAAITGGHSISKEINEILAKAAEAENIIMSVGSQRAGLEDSSLQDSFKIVRQVAPNIPIIGNIGIGQVSDSNFKVEDFKQCIDMINADVMAIHLNALHELVQDKGNISYSLFKKKFTEIRKEIKIPIIAKEVGAGFNRDAAITIDNLGFNGFDIGGAGGTSFAAIESKRGNQENDSLTRVLGDVFREWGNPTPVSVFNVRNVSKKTIIATGGLKTGIDIAKSIVLGADIGGFAYSFLKSAWKDYKEKTILNTIKEIKTLKKELQSSLWLMNVKTIEELKSNESKRIILGKLYQWFNN